MKMILTLIYAALLVSTQALPAGASLHAAMYCWVPDFEIAVACDDDDEGGSDGDDSLREPVPAGRVGAASTGRSARRLGSERP